MEWKLFGTPTAYVSTAEYHHDRAHANHLEDPMHYSRLMKSFDFVREAVVRILNEANDPGFYCRIADLGCGDGGLLSLIRDCQEPWAKRIMIRGYDFAPANVQYAQKERKLFHVLERNVFPPDGPLVIWPSVLEKPIDVAIMTEVLEHLTRPHDVLKELAPRVKWLVCSSPWNETDRVHADCHAWAWDIPGFQKLLIDAGFEPVLFTRVKLAQVVLSKGKA